MTSTTDKIGCALQELGLSIQQIDDKFAKEDGSIKVQGADEILELLSLLYSTLKRVYENCLGREFEISLGDSSGAKAIASILKLLLELLPDGQTVTKTSA